MLDKEKFYSEFVTIITAISETIMLLYMYEHCYFINIPLNVLYIKICYLNKFEFDFFSVVANDCKFQFYANDATLQFVRRNISHHDPTDQYLIEI